MKYRLILSALCLFLVPSLRAQVPGIFKGTFTCEEHKVTLALDLYEETVTVPGFSFLGKMHGYLAGKGVYGTWLVTGKEIKDNTATIRMSNDTGSDAQTIELKLINDSVFQYRTVAGNSLRRAVGNKLVRIADKMTFKRRR